jgi:hypothetical protein
MRVGSPRGARRQRLQDTSPIHFPIPPASRTIASAFHAPAGGRRPDNRTLPRAPAFLRRAPPARRARHRPRKAFHRRDPDGGGREEQRVGKGLGRGQVSPPTITAARLPRPSQSMIGRRSARTCWSPRPTRCPRASRLASSSSIPERGRVDAEVFAIDASGTPRASRCNPDGSGVMSERGADHAARATRDERAAPGSSATAGIAAAGSIRFTVSAMSGAVSASVPSRSNSTARSTAAQRLRCS